MIVYQGEDPNYKVWEVDEELPCGCTLTNPQAINLFGQHVGGQRGFSCVHGARYTVSVHVLTNFKFKIQKGIQP